MLGQEVSATPAEADRAGSRNDDGFAEALMRQLADELEEDGRRVIGDSLAAVAQQYEDAAGFGTNALRARAEKFYNSGALAPSALHRGLASLPFCLIVTTCHDDLMLRALKEAGKSPLAYRYHMRGDKRDNPEFVLSGSASAPVVYHLFGNAREPGSLVLSENDLLDFLIAMVSERPPLPNSLSRALRRSGQSFLFVGFGISQWYLRVLMKVLVRSLELHRTASSIAAESLRGLSESDRERTILFYQRGTRIEVEDADVSEFLAELAQRLAAEGGVVAETPRWGPVRAFSSATPAKTARLRPSFLILSTAPASSPGSTKMHWSEGRIGTSGFATSSRQRTTRSSSTRRLSAKRPTVTSIRKLHSLASEHSACAVRF